MTVPKIVASLRDEGNVPTSVRLMLNGSERTVTAHPHERLLDVLRHQLHLLGTKEGCGEGECGACSVLLNDEVVNACLIFFGQLSEGDAITTIEGIGEDEHLTPLQQAFIHTGGTQCGICTPGMIIAATALLRKYPKPTREQILEGLAGNLCRCTGYASIVEAVEQCAKRRRQKRTKR